MCAKLLSQLCQVHGGLSFVYKNNVSYEKKFYSKNDSHQNETIFLVNLI